MLLTKPLNVMFASGVDGGFAYMQNLPWKLRGDLKRFREITMGNVLIMGRKTYESLPKKLDGRKIIVVSETLRDITVSLDKNVFYAGNLEEAIYLAEKLNGMEVFVVGGVALISEAIKLPCTIYHTLVHKVAPEGYDRYVKDFKAKDFDLMETSLRTVFDLDEETGFPIPSHTYAVYKSPLLRK